MDVGVKSLLIEEAFGFHEPEAEKKDLALKSQVIANDPEDSSFGYPGLPASEDRGVFHDFPAFEHGFDQDFGDKKEVLGAWRKIPDRLCPIGSEHAGESVNFPIDQHTVK